MNNPNKTTKIKICGIQNLPDALFCESLGVDAISFVFYPKSPRLTTIENVKNIIKNLPPFITTIGLFANSEHNYIKKILKEVNLDCLQFHGDEDNDFCKQFNKKWFKAIRVQDDINLSKEINKFKDANAVLLDSFDKTIIGGTGKVFNWQQIPKNLTKPVILAGGLTPENVGLAIKKVKPWAVDVSGGVESSKGVKSQELIKKFVKKIKNCYIN